MKSGMIFDIKKFAVHDGPGIRTTVFMKGCPLNCIWCHNPESRSNEYEKIVKKTKVVGKEFSAETFIGKEVNTSEVIFEVLKDKIFYEESKGGVTFSGGEPLMQSEFLRELLETSKGNELHTAVDTCGFAARKVFVKILPFTDLILYDLKLINDKLHKKYTGVSNKQIIENLQFLISEKVNVIIRIPLIPTITDTEENISEIIRYLHEVNYEGQINLLPFHKTANNKYKNLNMINPMENLIEDKVSISDEIISRFTKAGFSVSLGG